ncbi:glycosyltransferase family 2 protein [Candidatus Woesearchaeota archaeon]|nr:glycosyltransferase family 2 protein [Candidatus Woesearchaeota archaeon]
MAKDIEISVVIPAYNEQENVELLYRKLKPVLDKLRKKHEIIIVDDGSTDKTFGVLKQLHGKDNSVKVIKFRRNFGQTAAFDAGFKQAAGNVIITMDADLQNDPEDIPKLLAKLDEGWDVVAGWRVNRKDSFSKRMFSIFANMFRMLLNDKLRIHDSGCSLKAYRKECLDDLDLYGEMHRFIPSLLAWKGFRIAEVAVKHNPRKFGKSKYNLTRLLKGFLDLLVVNFWMKYSARPIHLFGGFGVLSLVAGFIINVYMVWLKFWRGATLSNRPLLLLGVMLVLLGVVLLVFGILADIMVKVYYRSPRTAYSIEKKLE